MLGDVVRGPRRAWRRRRQQLGNLKHHGDGGTIHETARLLFPRNISIGRLARIGDRCYLEGYGGIEIGDGTILAPAVTILSSSHRYDQPEYLPYGAEDERRPVVVGRGVWLGYGAMLVPGVTVGDGAVVAMGSVVTRDVPPGAVVGGNPASVIGQRDPELVASLVARGSYYLGAVVKGEVKRVRVD